MLTGCDEMRIEEFSGRRRSLDVFAYFSGNSRAWGLFEDRFGRLRREFTVAVVGHRLGESELRLEEDFVYADGETQRRVWLIRRTGSDTYVGEADDVVGIARGRATGNSLHWRYVMALKINGSTWNVDFDDRMFLQPDDVLLSRARVSKWGIALGEVTLSFQREPAAIPAMPAPEPALVRIGR
jgi:hypothetical protein